MSAIISNELQKDLWCRQLQRVRRDTLRPPPPATPFPISVYPLNLHKSRLRRNQMTRFTARPVLFFAEFTPSAESIFSISICIYTVNTRNPLLERVYWPVRTVVANAVGYYVFLCKVKTCTSLTGCACVSRRNDASNNSWNEMLGIF